MIKHPNDGKRRRATWVYGEARANLRAEADAKARLQKELARRPKADAKRVAAFRRRLNRVPEDMRCPLCRETKPDLKQWSTRSGVCRSCERVHRRLADAREEVASFVQRCLTFVSDELGWVLDGAQLKVDRTKVGASAQTFADAAGWTRQYQFRLETQSGQVREKCAEKILQAFAELSRRSEDQPELPGEARRMRQRKEKMSERQQERALDEGAGLKPLAMPLTHRKPKGKLLEVREKSQNATIDAHYAEMRRLADLGRP